MWLRFLSWAPQFPGANTLSGIILYILKHSLFSEAYLYAQKIIKSSQEHVKNIHQNLTNQSSLVKKNCPLLTENLTGVCGCYSWADSTLSRPSYTPVSKASLKGNTAVLLHGRRQAPSLWNRHVFFFFFFFVNKHQVTAAV